MVKLIRWSDEANEIFENISSYLQEHHSLKTATKFADAVYAKIDVLILYPDIGRPSSKNSAVRIVLIDKQIIMFYKFDGNELLIVDFFNTRQDPQKRKY
jgi:plasmid stabilization system protein ParE